MTQQAKQQTPKKLTSHDYARALRGLADLLESKPEFACPAARPVSRQDAHDALIYRDGILDYAAHDAYLRALGYEYLALHCSCSGTDDDGHVPSCGWGIRTASADADVSLGSRDAALPATDMSRRDDPREDVCPYCEMPYAACTCESNIEALPQAGEEEDSNSGETQEGGAQ